MRRIAYSQRLEGRLTPVGPGLAAVELAADGETPLGRDPVLTSRLSFASERSFREEGTLTFSGGVVLRFTTLGRGDLAPAPGTGVQHGTAVLAVAGEGVLGGARGRITSNFVVGEDGALTDDQVVVLFIDEGGER
jgi:hypothetical protein